MKIATGLLLLLLVPPTVARSTESTKIKRAALEPGSTAAVALPAERRLASDGITLASVGCKVSAHDLPPYHRFKPTCMMHLRELIAEVDKSYTDVHLASVLEHHCWYEKQFPKSCDSGFDKEKHCRAFAKKLVVARDEELKKGSTDGYKNFCNEYFVLKGGVLPKAEAIEENGFSISMPPMYTVKTMPEVSTTLYCIINLTMQYFLLYTALAVVRTLIAFKFDLVGVQQILESGCSTVTYAPMLCVLFLAARMRAIQLTQGETEMYKLPQPWVQTSMIVASSALMLQVVLVLFVGVVAGTSKGSTDTEGNLDISSMQAMSNFTVIVLTALRYVVMLMLYGGFTAVVIGIFMMKGPKEIWGEEEVPVSPAVMCTILLSGLFFTIYVLVAITKTCFELSPSLRSSPVLLKLEASVTSAKMTVNFAPMLCILFIGARMRALQIDPKHGNPQSWAQKAFFVCTFSVLLQALLVILMPFVAKGNCRRGAFEGDVAFSMDNPTVGALMTGVRYICLLGLYGGITIVVYSVFVIQHPDGPSKTPPVSAAMQCVITLTAQYFLVYTLLFVCITVKSFLLGAGLSGSDDLEEAGRLETQSRVSRAMSQAIAIFDAARGTVMYAPMLSILFIAARMRALQLARAVDGKIPPSAGPQMWVQDAMFLATWAVSVQLVMAMLVPLLTGSSPAIDEDGNTKVSPGTSKSLAVGVEFVRYLSLVCMYGGAMVVVVGIFCMTPGDLPPYNKRNLVPGVGVPQPPVPATAEPL